jgi:hypothetical protein
MTVAAKLRGRWDDSSLEKDAEGHFFMDQAVAFFSNPRSSKYLRAQACMMPHKLTR